MKLSVSVGLHIGVNWRAVWQSNLATRRSVSLTKRSESCRAVGKLSAVEDQLVVEGEFGRVEQITEFLLAFPRVEITLQLIRSCVDVGKRRQGRNGAAYAPINVGCGRAPVRAERYLGAIARNQYRFGGDGSRRVLEVADRGESRSISGTAARYLINEIPCLADFHVGTTTRRRATRCSSAGSSVLSCQWRRVRIPSAASKRSFLNGNDMAVTLTTVSDPAGHWRIIVIDGSTVTT